MHAESKGGSVTHTETPHSATENHAAAREEYGLHAGVLGPVETLAQSVSAMAPSTSSSLTIPLVFALAGNGTWFVYLLATGATLLVGFCVSRFARISASPGSLYTYTAEALPPFFGVTAAWALLMAYLATGASVAGGALYYAVLLCEQFLHWSPNHLATLLAVCALAAAIAYRDVKLSAEVMLWIEAASLCLIVLVLSAILYRAGFHIDLQEVKLRGVHPSALGPALVLALFSFVGFESATTLGAEARDPLRTIPRAVIQCAVLAGVFFVLCSYSEVLGFRGEPGNLSETTSPLHLLAEKADLAGVGVAIDFGAGISMFACVLACIIAAARVLMRMAHGGLLPSVLAGTSRRHGTPGYSIGLSAVLMLGMTSGLALRGVRGEEMYDLLGSLAVFGFLTAYTLIAIALPFARRAVGQHSIVVAGLCILTVAVMILITVFDLRSTTDAAHARLPQIYVCYLAVGIGWYALAGWRLRRAPR